MKLNDAGIKLIKSFEGCDLKVYKDMVGYNTVGYGHRTTLGVGSSITKEQASQMLLADLQLTCEGIKKALKVELTDNQFSALVSFAYNLGVGALRSSSLLRLVNEKAFLAAANEFEKWDNAAGREVPGLHRRRLAERALFLTT